MQQRNDLSHYARLVKAGAMTKEQASRFAALPYILVPKPTEQCIRTLDNIPRDPGEEFTQWDKAMFKGLIAMQEEPEKFHSDLAETDFVIFNEFIFSIFDSQFIHLKEDLVKDTYEAHMVTVGSSSLYEIKYKDATPYIYTVNNIDPNKPKDLWECEQLAGLKRGEADKMIAHYDNAMVLLLVFLRFHAESDRYPVKVSPVKRARVSVGAKAKLAAKAGPNIIYLNRMPSNRENVATIVGESHTHKAPHQRRGYYKTLKAEVYKTHPRYMVPNGVYVRPAWIGDKTAIVNGNIYTVMV